MIATKVHTYTIREQINLKINSLHFRFVSSAAIVLIDCNDPSLNDVDCYLVMANSADTPEKVRLPF